MVTVIMMAHAMIFGKITFPPPCAVKVNGWMRLHKKRFAVYRKKSSLRQSETVPQNMWE